MTETINLTERADVREKYGAAALTVLQGKGATCCGGNAGGGSDSCCGSDAITGGLYDAAEASAIPDAALLASLGCGNPTALAALTPVKWCWIWAVAAELMSCSQRGELGKRVLLMGWT